jgi:hypothetical protein
MLSHHVPNLDHVKEVQATILAAQIKHVVVDGKDHVTVPTDLDKYSAFQDADEIVNGEQYRITANQI